MLDCSQERWIGLPFSELLEGPAIGVPSTANPDRFKDTTSAQLSKDLLRGKLPSSLSLIWLDTTNVMDVRNAKRVHQTLQRTLEDGAERRLP